MGAFIACVLVGCVAAFWIFLTTCRAITREDRRIRTGRAMPSAPPNPSAAMARRIVGYYAELPDRPARPVRLRAVEQAGDGPDEIPPTRLGA